MYILGGEKPDWKEDDLCMIIDTATGKPKRFCGSSAVITISEAKNQIENSGNWADRSIIVRLDCIVFNN